MPCPTIRRWLNHGSFLSCLVSAIKFRFALCQFPTPLSNSYGFLHCSLSSWNPCLHPRVCLQRAETGWGMLHVYGSSPMFFLSRKILTPSYHNELHSCSEFFVIGLKLTHQWPSTLHLWLESCFRRWQQFLRCIYIFKCHLIESFKHISCFELGIENPHASSLSSWRVSRYTDQTVRYKKY